MLRQKGRLDVLYVPRDPNDEDDLHFPSWVPDWRHHSGTRVPFIPLLDGTYLPTGEPVVHSKHTASPANILPQIDFSTDGLSVRLSGFAIDTIHAVGYVHKHHSPNGISFAQRFIGQGREQETFNQWEQIIQIRSHRHYKPTGEPMEEAYRRTIIAGTANHKAENVSRGFNQWHRIYRAPLRLFSSSMCLSFLGPALVILAYLLLFVPLLLMSSREDLMAFRSAMTNAEGRRIFRTTKGIYWTRICWF